MFEIMEVKSFTNDNMTKCWINTQDVNFETMIILSFLCIALEKLQIIRGGFYNIEGAQIIIRSKTIQLIEFDEKSSIEDAWEYLGKSVIRKSVNQLDKWKVNRTYDYIGDKILPIIYKDYEVNKLSEDQLIV